MRMFFTVVARFFASIFAILYVITTVLALLLAIIGRQMFNANLYKSTLVEQQIYKHLSGLIGELLTTSISYNPCATNPLVCENKSPELEACFKQALGNDRYTTLASGQDQPTTAEKQLIQPCVDRYGGATAIGNTPTGGQGGMPPFMQNLTAANWESIINTIVPPEELQVMTENTLDQLSAYLNGETDTVTISLVKLKGRLSGQAGIDAITQLMRAQPACTPEQLTQMTGSTVSGGSGMILCNPGEDKLNAMIPQLQEQLNAVVTQIPDETAIIKPPLPGSSSPGGGPFGKDPITTIRMARLILRLSPLLPLAFLLLITPFSVRSLKGWMRWWGIPTFIAGAITLGLGIAALPALDQAWNTYVVVKIPPYISTSITKLGHGLIRYIAHNLDERIVLGSIILVLLGLAAWIGSYFVKTPSDQTPQTA